MSVCAPVYVHVHTSVCVCAYVCACLCTCMYVSMCVPVHEYLCVYHCAYLSVYLCVCLCVRLCVYTCTPLCAFLCSTGADTQGLAHAGVCLASTFPPSFTPCMEVPQKSHSQVYLQQQGASLVRITRKVNFQVLKVYSTYQIVLAKQFRRTLEPSLAISILCLWLPQIPVSSHPPCP